MSLYRSEHPGILVFKRLAVGRFIGWGLSPTSDEVEKSMRNGRWSPTPYPIGIAQAFKTSTSGVAQIASMGRVPRKCVAVSCVPVKRETASCRSRLGVRTSAFPNLLSYTWSLASKQTIRRRPWDLQSVRRVMRSCSNFLRGHVVSDLAMVRYARCS